MPVSAITVRTSAKSTLIRPGRVMSSAMPCTAPCSTWFAALNASSSVVSPPSTVRSFWFGMVISESTYLPSSPMPCSASACAWHLHLEGLGHDGDGQDVELLRDLRDHRRRARAGATAHARRDEQHVAAFDELDDAVAILHRGLAADLGIGAGAEALVMFEPIWMLVLTRACFSACASVLTQTKSTPSIPEFTMCATALPPPPPTPTTLMIAP